MGSTAAMTSMKAVGAYRRQLDAYLVRQVQAHERHSSHVMYQSRLTRRSGTRYHLQDGVGPRLHISQAERIHVLSKFSVLGL